MAHFRELIAGLHANNVAGRSDTLITGIAYDSRRVQAGYLFVAMRGFHVDGHSYIERAVQAGAAAVLYEDTAVAPLLAGVASAQVPNARVALAPLATAFYGHPGRSLRVVGVTGSKGKTTTATLASIVLQGDSDASGLITTVDFKIGERWWPNKTRQTTPEALEIQALLRAMVDANCTYAVVESSSHGLSPRWNRLGGCEFDLAVLTNITHEHLDFHGSFAQYRADKGELFAMLGASVAEKQIDGAVTAVPKVAIVNLDDPNAAYFLGRAAAAKPLTYAITNPSADVRASNIRESRSGLAFTAHTPVGAVEMHSNLPGSFNVPNLLAALCVGLSQGVPLETCAARLAAAPAVRGRMATIEQGQPFSVLVDYAHNPDSFEKLMAVMRPLTAGKLIAVFGSAGERDREKRPIQGAIAARFCDFIVLSDEDPRGEDRDAIIGEIAAGIEQRGKREGREYLRIADRAAAIRAALAHAAPGDIVLLLGKGHEDGIIYADHTLPWDEAGEARQALAELGWRK